MTHIECPACGRDVLIGKNCNPARPECPFCGEVIPFPETENANDFDAAEKVTPTTSPESVLLVEESREKLLYHLRSGGKTSRSIGCFAILWNLISWTLFGVLMANGFRDGQKPMPVFAILIILLFPVVGIGLIIWWIRLRFETALIWLTPSELIIQRDLFGWKRMQTIAFGPQSRFDLVEAYSENDVPVYALSIAENGQSLSFGTSLSQQEKEQLKRRLNSYLDDIHGKATAVDEAPAATSLAEARARLEQIGVVFEDLDSHRVKLDIGPELLNKDRWSVVGCLTFLVLCSVVIHGILAMTVWQGRWIQGIGGVLFVLGDVLVIVLTLQLAVGRLQLTIGPEQFEIRWGKGLLSWPKVHRTLELREFVIEIPPLAPNSENRIPRTPRLMARKQDGTTVMITFDKPQWGPLLRDYLNFQLREWQS